ncbi:MAG: 6-phosphogluconolactonase [Bacteroidales bacterium]|nr:6-phosphogluconolactonase [Bacteroidales bacterium]
MISSIHDYELIPVEISHTPTEACRELAEKIIDRANRAKSGERPFRLAISSGSSPEPLLDILSEAYRAGKVSFSAVELFTVDEYYPYDGLLAHSRNRVLRRSFIDVVDLKQENIHWLDGLWKPEEVEAKCAEWDEQAKGLDMLIMGIGEQGQLGLNEPGTRQQYKTRLVLLSWQSRKRQTGPFGGEIDKTPMNALTMGVSTMLTAKEIHLLAWGEDKAAIVKRVSEDQWNPDCPASLLQLGENVSFHIDKDAAVCLTRVVAPWLVGHCQWEERLIRKAVVWLCETVRKPILKLTYQDYVEHALGELVTAHGPYDSINIKVFNDLQHTITGWPGGKPGADDTFRPVKSTPFPKTVVVFSPHPDDDVISMGGTLIRLSEQGHNVHVAYETSGNVAVHDDVVMQHIDTIHELGYADDWDRVASILASKRPGEAEPRELLNIKGSIRRAEARAALRSFGLSDTHAHFLNLPFYETGGIAKNPATQDDVDIVKSLLLDLQPQQIYMAGDLADPHGTHRVCTMTALEAVRQLREEGHQWAQDAVIWLYRGAWMEWEPGDVDMAVPLSPQEMIKKRHAIYRHLSQKDIVPFPGDDSREFWQRAEERTQNTAKLYDSLGMAEYQAIELFVKYTDNI